MSYAKQSWADGSAGGTPITAARLSYIEDGVAAVAATADAAEATLAGATDSLTPDTIVRRSPAGYFTASTVFLTENWGDPGAATRKDYVDGKLAAKADKSANVFDVTDYGAVGNGTTDDTAAINAATNAARMSSGRRGGTVFFPAGQYKISAPINLYTAVSLVGEGRSLDTTYYNTSALVAAPGFVGSAMVLLNPDGATVVSPPGPDESWHYATIERLAIVGNGVAGPHGIDPGWFGETSVIDSVQFYNCNSGIYLNSIQASATLRSVSMFDCSVGLNCDGINGMVRVFGLSGDNNVNLLRVKGGLSANVTVIGMKAENYDAGTGDPVVEITDLDGGAVTLIGGWCDTNGARNTVVKLSKTGATTNYPRVNVQGVYANANYTNLINDTIASKVVPRGLDALGVPTVHYNHPVLQQGQGGPMIGSGNSLKGIGSSAFIADLVTMEADDSSSFKAASGTVGGRLKSSGGTSQMRWNNTGLAFFGGAPAAKPTVTGSRGGNAAVASLLTALAGLGLITDSSTA